MLSNNGDDPPPYLSVGTEVSAKFKGAFCEAKIKKVDKCVKCKITYKHNFQQLTVSDELIRSVTGQALTINEFKLGTLVSVVKSISVNNTNPTDSTADTGNVLATLNKVIDQSSYTVIFNDGDEKVVRRSFIRFKGEKHYLDSETLNNAPLNNPEHFLYPIKNNSASNNNNDTANSGLNEESAEEEDLDEIFEKKTRTRTSNEPDSKKKNVKSSNDNDENSENYPIEENSRKFNESQHNDESNQNNSSDDDDDDDSSSSDDYPSEVKDRFVAQLYKFMDDRGTPMNRVPTINSCDIDLHKFFIVVRRFGGYNKVCKLRNWADVYKRLGLPNSHYSSNIINIKSAYKRYLQPFEDFYRKLGSTMCDLVSRHTSNCSNTKRPYSDSHRSLQLFKNRYINSSASQKKTISKYKQKQLITAQVTKASSVDNNNSNKSSTNNTPELISNTNERERSLSANRCFIDEASNENNSNLESISVSSNTTLSNLNKNLIDDQTQQQEELTLFSMVRNLNENFKKAKKQEKEKKEKEPDLFKNSNEIKSEPQTNEKTSLVKEDIKKNAKANSIVQKRPMSANITPPVKSKGRRASLDKLNLKYLNKSERLSSKSDTNSESNNHDYGEDEQLDESKTKRKNHRSSTSANDDTQTIETKKGVGIKRKNSLSVSNSKSASSNTENDESDKDNNSNDDVNIGNSINSYSEPNDNDSNENEGKTNLTIKDLEVNRIVDVKYVNGNQKHDYPAKIVQINPENRTIYVHYLGWNTRYDEWVKIDRIKRILSDDYNGHKRRKVTTKNNSSNSNGSNETQSVSSPNRSNEQTNNNNQYISKESNATSSKSKNSCEPSTSKSVVSKSERIAQRSWSSSTTSSLNDQFAIKDELCELKKQQSQSKTSINDFVKSPLSVSLKSENLTQLSSPTQVLINENLNPKIETDEKQFDSSSSNISTCNYQRDSSEDHQKIFISVFSTSDQTIKSDLNQRTPIECDSKMDFEKNDLEFDQILEKEKPLMKENQIQLNESESYSEVTINANSTQNLNSILSIKEEIMEIETNTNFLIENNPETVQNFYISKSNKDDSLTAYQNSSCNLSNPNPIVEELVDPASIKELDLVSEKNSPKTISRINSETNDECAADLFQKEKCSPENLVQKEKQNENTETLELDSKIKSNETETENENYNNINSPEIQKVSSPIQDNNCKMDATQVKINSPLQNQNLSEQEIPILTSSSFSSLPEEKNDYRVEENSTKIDESATFQIGDSLQNSELPFPLIQDNMNSTIEVIPITKTEKSDHINTENSLSSTHVNSPISSINQNLNDSIEIYNQTQNDQTNPNPNDNANLNTEPELSLNNINPTESELQDKSSMIEEKNVVVEESSTGLANIEDSKKSTANKIDSHKSDSKQAKEPKILTSSNNSFLEDSNNSNSSFSNSKKNDNLVFNSLQNNCSTLLGKQRIRYIEEQMKLCREVYAKLKNEIAAIDRKKKKLKRNLLDKSNPIFYNANMLSADDISNPKQDNSYFKKNETKMLS